MMMRRWAGVLAAAVLLAGCTSQEAEPEAAPTAAADPLTLDRFYEQQLDWRTCGGSFECATLQVPRDYDNPDDAGEFSLQVLRLTSSQSEGSLVVNPGGPGGSGVDYARAARAIVGPEVIQEYDIVGFDPRGVATSDPVDCLDDEQIDALIQGDPTPDDEAEVQQLIADSAAMGEGCAERSPDVYRWMDTVSAAKDMDILRAALGDEQLNYLGKSYGTSLGAAYAELFPENVGRFVLDGAVAPDLTSEKISLGQAVAFEVGLQRFVADCLNQADCPLQASTVEEGVAEIGAFLASLETAPLPVREGRDLNEALGAASILYYLYFPPSDWAELRVGLTAAFAGDGSVLLNMLDRRLQRDSTTGEFADNSQEAFYAVNCLDREVSDVSEISERAQAWADQAPTFGPYLAWSDAVCAQWPSPPVNEPTVVTADGSGPILVVSTQYDTATPYEWGVRLNDMLSNSALVSYNGDGHTAYRNGSTCVDQVVDTYLLTGELPTEDPRCGY